MTGPEISLLILEILSEIKDCDDIQNDTMLIDTGIIDSMSILYLISELEEKLGIAISLEDVVESNFLNINNITEFVLECANPG